jgi:hypothetical protein
MGEGVIEHKKAGGCGSSPSESYGDSRAMKELGGETRIGRAKGKNRVGVGRSGVEEGERVKKHR